MDYRSEFSEFGSVIYLDVAAQGPLPRASAQAMRRAVELKEQPQKMPDGLHIDLPDRVRKLLARLVGAKPSEIAITTGASTGLGAIACGIDWKPEDEVLIAEGEFPATFTAFAPLADSGRLRLNAVRARERFLRAEDFVASIGPRTRLVATSLVRFQDSARLDSRALADACHKAGAQLALDVSQCCGAMPVDVKQLGADFVVSSGYKWLLGPYGTGFFWVREDLIDGMRPAPFYWTALAESRAPDTLGGASSYRPEPGARRWDAPETANLNLVAMEASLEFLLKVGVEEIWRHNRQLIGQLLDRLPLDRCLPASPADPDSRGPYVCVAARSAQKTADLYRRLRQSEIVLSLRAGAIRIAPHLYNSAGDIERVTAALTI